MLLVLLLSIAGNDAPAAVGSSPPRTETRCQDARVHTAAAGEDKTPVHRSLGQEPLANAYRPVVRFVGCDVPVKVASRVGQQQR